MHSGCVTDHSVVSYPNGNTTGKRQVSTAIPESPLYNQLLDMDRLVTDMISRRKADFKEPFPPYHEPVKRVLRITIQV